MMTIVDPKDYIVKLWGEQPVKNNCIYRPLKYILRVDYNGHLLLHNIVTGHLVVLSKEEKRLFESLPCAYSPLMNELVSRYFLVPNYYNEHQQVVNLRTVLRKLNDSKWKKEFTQFTILPTTACNANCYYCFEQGLKQVSMTDETVENVVEFIKNNCSKERKLSIMWFGGEPTLGSNQIDLICNGLRKYNLKYDSGITTNGYLLEGKMIQRAKSLWNLKIVKISVDGTENTYNRIKAFKSAQLSPYSRVMRNIKELLEKDITVSLRMNFDISNYQEFFDLADECAQSFSQYKHFHLHAHPVNGEFINQEGILQHGTEEWFSEKYALLNEYARQKGLLRNNTYLPFMRFNGCIASDNNALVINPTGELARCPEEFEGKQIVGTIKDGISDFSLFDSWTRFADYERCSSCSFFPYCDRLVNCNAKNRCTNKLEYIQKYQQSMIFHFNSHMQHQKGGKKDVFRGA